MRKITSTKFTNNKVVELRKETDIYYEKSKSCYSNKFYGI